MSTAPHPVAPEEIMAHLDGELSAARAQSVSAHVESCADCQTLAASLRSTAHALAHWTVEPAAASLDRSIFENLTRQPSPHGAGVDSIHRIRLFWSRPLPWALAAVGLLVLFSAGTFYRASSPSTAFDSFMAYSRRKSVAEQSEVPGSTVTARLTDPAQNSVEGQPAKHKSRVVPERKAQAGGYLGWLQPEPMIARTVSLSLIAKDFESARASLDGILARHNGYAADLNVATPQSAARSLQASLRIPALQLPAALAELKALGRVELEAQNGEEVTQQHADLVARLKNSRETEQRLQAILTERTGKIGDVLSVEQEIARVRGEIEQMEAEQKNLEHRVDFATINLQLSEEYKAKLEPPAPAISTLIHNAAVNGYRNVADTLLSIVLFFAEYGPVLIFWLLVLALPATLVWRRWRQATAAI
jgi:anti-sigma factor RsiW